MLFIGICGASGSGKSTLAHELAKMVNKSILIINQDAYYYDHPDMSFEDRCLLNYDEPQIFDKVSKYISPDDFTVDLYKQVADKLFKDLREGNYNPAAIISMFTDEEEHREVAAMFNTNLPELTSKQEREKALKDIVNQRVNLCSAHTCFDVLFYMV